MNQAIDYQRDHASPDADEVTTMDLTANPLFQKRLKNASSSSNDQVPLPPLSDLGEGAADAGGK